LAVLALAVAFVTVLTLALLRFIVPRPPEPQSTSSTPLGPPLTRHLVFVIVDGLRYDIALDPAWMPALSSRMRASTHAEIWSGPVSMTSSAILTYATGQRGDLDQIVNNETGSAVSFDHLIGNAREAALVTAYTGDRAWLRMFPDAWNLSHPDPYGVAIDVDYNAEIFAAAYRFLGSSPRPNLTVVHFVTPDHQAHAYGVFSDRYRAHLRGFDADLDALLGSLPSDTTVFVTSDHGATDTGTHGADTPVQRRSPIFAYGPGVVVGRSEPARLDQIDLAATFAVLLGIAPPAQSRGHLLADWLDLPDERRADLACADLTRLRRYAAPRISAQALQSSGIDGACSPERGARARVESAALAARAVGAELDRSGGPGLAHAWLVPALALLGGAALALSALGRGALERRREIGAAAALVAVLLSVSLALTWGLELLPGRWPNVGRAALYVIGNAALLWAALRPRATAAWMDARPAIAAAVLPGLLAVTPTKTTQIESLVLCAVLAFFALTVGIPGASSSLALAPSSWRLPRGRVALTAVLLALMIPVGIANQGYLPSALTGKEVPRLAMALASLTLLAVARHHEERMAGRAARGDAMLLAVGVAAAFGSLILRPRAPAPLCIALWVLMPIAAWLAWTRGRHVLGELLSLASYAQVARDDELPVLVASYLVARAVGAGLASSAPAEQVRPAVVICATTFLFAWTFLQRIGIQGGIDFVQLDWGAGAFREQGVGMWRIGTAIVYKHSFARAAVLLAVLSALHGSTRTWTARALLVTETLRLATLATTLYVCRDSFWTSLRAIGDVPHALAAVTVASAALVVVCGASRTGAREGGSLRSRHTKNAGSTSTVASKQATSPAADATPKLMMALLTEKVSAK
jgi:hypothetical protein